MEICQEKINRFEELPRFSAYFFSDEYTIDEKTQNKILKRNDVSERIQEIIPVLESLSEWHASSIETAIQALAEEKGLKIFAWFPLLRFAVSGVGAGPDLLPMLEVLEQKRVVERLKKLLGTL